jgi:hypothetical protein
MADLSTRIVNKGYYNVLLSMSDGSILPLLYKAGKKKEPKVGSATRAKSTRPSKETRYRAIFKFHTGFTNTVIFASVADVRAELLTGSHYMLAEVKTEQKQGLAEWQETEAQVITRADCIRSMSPNKIPEYKRPKHIAYKKKTCGFGGPNKLRWIGKAHQTMVSFSRG